MKINAPTSVTADIATQPTARDPRDRIRVNAKYLNRRLIDGRPFRGYTCLSAAFSIQLANYVLMIGVSQYSFFSILV